MPQTSFHKVYGQYFVYSWTTGCVLAHTARRIKNDKDALAHALYLVNQGLEDEADLFLERYCSMT